MQVEHDNMITFILMYGASINNTLLTIRAKGTIEGPATDRRVITTKMNRRRKIDIIEYNQDKTARAVQQHSRIEMKCLAPRSSP
jgi:hypothetical protein